ncbi:MAG: extracellular solute-binding protein, partial [Erysipelotrichaceae bacterium]|nr:extracellular solute-binding protein [Erysipelotrichaceae bacterium]
MKKLLAVLLAVFMCLTLAACAGGNGGNTEEKSGSVYYLNFKPEADEAWQKLAAQYTEQTGVEVKVVTAASGTYDTTLQNELGKSGAPTLFNVGNAGAVSTYGDYCYNLKGTPVYEEMTTHSFDQAEGDMTYSIGYVYESFGIICNKALLAEAGHDISEITNFETLKAVVEDIHARAGELGFDAFTSSGLDGSSSWRFSGHLATAPLFYEGVNKKMEIKGTYLNEFKNLWDLYINNSATDPVANNT